MEWEKIFPNHISDKELISKIYKELRQLIIKKQTICFKNGQGGNFWQDGGVGIYTLPPHTTKRRSTTNLKIKNNKNYQKIKLYGSLTTKELKKKHSSRPVEGAELGSEVERTCGKVVASRSCEAVAGGPGGPTFACR